MRRLWIALLVALPAVAITDEEIRAEVARIEKLAAQDSPRLAVPALLRAAAVVQPVAPAERQKLLLQAAALARGASLSHGDVRAWMKLDPEGGEAALRKLPDQGGVLDALAGYRRTPALAEEAIRADLPRALEREFSWRLLATHRPEEAVALFGDALEAGAPRRVMEATRALVDGLGAASPPARAPAVTKFAAMKDRIAAAATPDFTMTLTYERGGRRIVTQSNAQTLAAWSELLAGPAAALESALTNFRRPSGANPPPVNAYLPLDEALRVLRAGNLYPPATHADELWRYLVMKPRTEAEARPILAALIEMAGQADARDPFWFMQSLLNLDGRGPRWELPAALRPTVFAAAARLGRRAQNAAQLQAFAEAMVAQGAAPPPDDAVSALLQYRIAQLAAELETRFDFTLPRLGGDAPVRLSSLRGKTVTLHFWRAPMPLPPAPPAGDNTAALVITDRESATGAGTVLFDRDRRVFEHYRVMGLPHAVTLDGDGRIQPRR